MAQPANSLGLPSRCNKEKFGGTMDSDSYTIAIDSCCSYFIAWTKQNITRPMIPCNIKIQVIAGGGCKVKWKDTGKFAIEDEDRIKRSIKIPNTMY